MRTIALRFGEHFSPKEGTIAEHQKLIEQYGFVWYGKMGSSVNDHTVKSILNNDPVNSEWKNREILGYSYRN